MEMITLKNKHLTATFSEEGAELKTLCYNDFNYMWSADPLVWGFTAPIMFPICGGLKDDKYIFNNKEYTLNKHGFAKNLLFDVESATDTKVTFLAKSNEETLKNYPFHFEFRVIFSLKGKALRVEYKVNNLSDYTMYFNVGAHEAFCTPEGIEDYDILFDNNVNLNSTMLYGSLFTKATFPVLKDSKVLPLYDKYFTTDSLQFNDISFISATLRNRKTGRALRVDFPKAKCFLLWHKHASGYICLEPWNGIPDLDTSDYDITKKEGITALKPNKAFSFVHTITIVE